MGFLATLATIILTSFIIIIIGFYRIIYGSESFLGLLTDLYVIVFLIPILWWILDSLTQILTLWITNVKFDVIDVLNLRAFSLSPLLFKATYIYLMYYDITVKLMIFTSITNIVSLITSLWTPIISSFLIKRYFKISLMKAIPIGFVPFLIKALIYLLI